MSASSTRVSSRAAPWSPTCVAVLNDTEGGGNLLRLAFYPGDALLYAGLWLDAELRIGWSAVDSARTEDRTGVSASIQVAGNHDLTVKTYAIWRPQERSVLHVPVEAEALVLGPDGTTAARLSLAPPRPNLLNPAYWNRITSQSA